MLEKKPLWVLKVSAKMHSSCVFTETFPRQEPSSWKPKLKPTSPSETRSSVKPLMVFASCHKFSKILGDNITITSLGRKALDLTHTPPTFLGTSHHQAFSLIRSTSFWQLVSSSWLSISKLFTKKWTSLSLSFAVSSSSPCPSNVNFPQGSVLRTAWFSALFYLCKTSPITHCFRYPHGNDSWLSGFTVELSPMSISSS